MVHHHGVASPRMRRPGYGWLSWVVLAVALAAAGAAAAVAKLGGASNRLAVTAAVVAAGIIPLGTALRTQLEQRRSASASSRSLTAGADKRLTLVRDVAPHDLRVHPSVRPDIPYIERDSDQPAIASLKQNRRLLIVGPSMSGKTSLALSVAKSAYPDFKFEQPADGQSIHKRLADGTSFTDVLIWLDDLERFTSSGLTDSDLVNLTTLHNVVVIATIRSSEYGDLQPRAGLKPPGWEVVRWFQAPVWLSHHWSDQELERLSSAGAGGDLTSKARTYGLANYLGGAPLVERELRIGRDENPLGYAVVQCAVDWRSIGMERRLTLGNLTSLIANYTDIAGFVTVEAQVARGVEWATRKLNQTVSLVGDVQGLEALDIVVEKLARRPDEVPAEVVRSALETASPMELMAIGYTFYRAGSTGTAVIAWERAAEENSQAGFYLGMLYSQDFNPARVREARTWYEASARAGHTGAMYNLGMLLIDEVVPPDLELARFWLQSAANTGETRAATNLAWLLTKQVEPPEYDLARRYYEQAAEEGEVAAMVPLGQLILDTSEPPEVDEARLWFKVAAEAGDVRGACHLAFLLENRTDPPDLVSARYWYEKAADGGHAHAMHQLALMLETKSTPPDLVAARSWYERAIASGHTSSAFDLGILLGDVLDPPDLEQARVSYEQAATAGHLGAMNNLGVMYETASPPDLKKAQYWLEKAASAGDLDAAYNLGRMFFHRVQPPDLESARYWWQAASEAGHGRATTDLRALVTEAEI